MEKIKKLRLDQILMKSDYFEDIKAAQGFIMAGKVIVEDIVCTKPGTQVKLNAKIFIRGIPLKFASKGGFKLEKALSVFKINVQDKIILDAGASTGGFTECLLKHGAKKIYAVDVGFGQLYGRLATNPQVVNLEKTNISDLRRETFIQPIDFCTVDLSYLSLEKAIPILKKLFIKPLHMVCLVKPLYEGLTRENMNDKNAIREILINLFHKLINNLNITITDCIVSPILGGKGAIEFLIHVLDRAELSFSAEQLVEKALNSLATDPPFELEKNELTRLTYEYNQY